MIFETKTFTKPQRVLVRLIKLGWILLSKLEMMLIGQSNRTIKTNQEDQKQYCGNLGKKKNGKEADD